MDWRINEIPPGGVEVVVETSLVGNLSEKKTNVSILDAVEIFQKNGLQQAVYDQGSGNAVEVGQQIQNQYIGLEELEVDLLVETRGFEDVFGRTELVFVDDEFALFFFGHDGVFPVNVKNAF